MHINCHTHIFTFQSVFSQHSIQTLVNRILEMSPPVLADKQLQRLIEDFMDARTTSARPEKKLADWLIDFQESDTLIDFFHRANPDTLKKLERARERLAALSDRENLLANGRILDELVAEDDDTDAGKKSVADFIDFIRIGFLPSIQAVADEVLGETPANAGIVALTMDITRSDLFEEQFIDQLEETAAAAVRYPGRIFPFVAVNPNRASHYAHMQRALTELKFKGVKLYPSLGYDLDSPAMHKVYTYCHENGVPLLMHCSKGGFYYAEPYIDNSAPAHWKAILGKFPKLKVCFGHFGGGGALTGPDLPGADTWAGQILDLMENWPGVFADVAYHDEPMEGGAAEARYFDNLKRLLEKETIQERILFGTDFFMNRVRLKDRNYWSYFKDRLGSDFDTIAETNPQRFLGL
ncbi:MAG: amidohydrolase [Desulfobacterales bacterium]|nr:amidohydrolase [Desulfobacterales bacterium]